MQSALLDVLVGTVNDVVAGGDLAAVLTIAALVLAGTSADLVSWKRHRDHNPKELP